MEMPMTEYPLFNSVPEIRRTVGGGKEDEYYK